MKSNEFTHKIVNLLHGKLVKCVSIDSSETVGGDGAEDENINLQYRKEYLQALTPSGFPPAEPLGCHFREPRNILVQFVPEVTFMLALFGYLVFLIIFKWCAVPSSTSRQAPSILLHFINMMMFSYPESSDSFLYGSQVGRIGRLDSARCSASDDTLMVRKSQQPVDVTAAWTGR
ncbi:VPP4 ATPase, partial [Polypterus senegalus]